MPASDLPWGSFLAFTLVNSITPGPNVILLASSGGQWGVRRTMPHLLGVCCGFPVMLLLILFGMSEVFKRAPWIFALLTVLSLAYVLWLAWRILAMGFRDDMKPAGKARPMTFMEAVLFQWINGKAWQIALMTATLFATDAVTDRLAMAAMMGTVTLGAGLAWIELGRRISALLRKPLVRKTYFAALAAALLVFTWPQGIRILVASL